MTAGALGLLLATAHADQAGGNWHFFGLSSLLIVWSGLRQGLRGGSIAFLFCASAAFILAAFLSGARSWNSLQGNMLAQGSIALLVGAASSWLQANESRYRQVIGHIPVVVYSARIPRWVPVRLAQGEFPARSGATLIEFVEITLASPACRKILAREPEQLLGPYQRWLDLILPADRELVLAALTQLCLQKQPITCEYRLQVDEAPLERPALPSDDSPQRITSDGPDTLVLPSFRGPVRQRWVRDTLAPHYSADGHLDGWEGVIEDITEQRMLAYDLRRTTGMFHALVANLPTGVFFLQGPFGQPLLVNGRARQLLGQREDNAAGIQQLSRVYRLHRPDGSAYPVEDLPVAKALRSGVTNMSEDIVVHRPDGRRVPLISWAAAIDLAGVGQPDAAVWVFEDLTDLRQAESAKLESEARLRAVFDAMAEGAVVHNNAGMIVDCNAAACAILDKTREQLLGQTFFATNCLSEGGSSCQREDLPDRRVLRSAAPVRDLILGVPRGGTGRAVETRWLLVNAMPLPASAGGVMQSRDTRIITTFSDITAHREALAVLQAAKAKYQDLVESLPVMVLQFDLSGNATYMNPAARHLCGFSLPELAGPGAWLERIVPEDRAAFQQALERARDGFVARAEFQFRAHDEVLKVGYGFLQPTLHDDVVVGATCLILDRTAQRRLEKDLERAQRLELIGKLASGTVHDFNNLLTIIMGRANLALAELVPEHPAHAELQRIQELGEQASHLVGQLLTFNKQQRLQRQPVDLNTLAVHTLRLLAGTLSRNIETRSVLAAEDIHVLADEQQLRQALMNLCLNARDAMPQGGTMSVKIDRASSPSAPASTSADGHWGRITVQDTGHGMSADVHARLFEPFFTTKEHGTGLGLPVVKQIVDSHSGRIFVHSQSDRGTAVEIWLPLARTARDEHATA
ncbi:MAG: PAS domain S-box protein [Planctomycetes bacterium]|nr:PAS domain S-box protein [Planctomycetota bacterium]